MPVMWTFVGQRFAGGLVAFAVLWLLWSGGEARAGLRDYTHVALVIGSGDYAGRATLPNAVQDSADIAMRLEKLGYFVVHLVNPTRQEVLRALAILQAGAVQAQQMVVYLSGHGVTLGGEAHYITVDALPDPTAPSETAGAVSALPIAIFAKAFSDRPRQKILFFDACRTPPELQNGVRTHAGPKWSAGVAVAFASAPSATAFDGGTEHSPFAEAFLRHATADAPDLFKLLRRMRQDVVARTQGAQVPWVQSSLLTQVFLQVPSPS